MFQKIQEIANEFGNWLLAQVVNLSAGLLSHIPVPDFLLNMQSYTLPDGVSFYVQAFMLEEGFLIIVSAYIARFILKRIPFIG